MVERGDLATPLMAMVAAVLVSRLYNRKVGLRPDANGIVTIIPAPCKLLRVSHLA